MEPIHIPLAGLLVAVAGCVTTQLVKPAEFIQTRGPEVVWVTTNDNARTSVAQPQILGDSLKGTRQGSPQDAVAISLKDINYVQAKVSSPTRTALLLAVVGAATIGASFALATGVDRFDGVEGCQHTRGTPVPLCNY